MDWLIVGVVSILINFWQFYSNGETKAERDQCVSASKHYKLEEQNARSREFESAAEKELGRQNIQRISARSKQRIRDNTESGSIACRAELDRYKGRLMDEARQRAREAAEYRLRSGG